MAAGSPAIRYKSALLYASFAGFPLLSGLGMNGKIKKILNFL